MPADKPSALVGIITGKMGEKPKEEEGEELTEKEAVAAEMLLAFRKDDPEMLVKAFEALFALCELEPHEEGPTKTTNRRDYEKPLPGGYIDESDL